MLRKILLLFIAISTSFNLSAQTITGFVSDKDTQTPISFVNIGISGKNIGTVSHQNGYFSLDLGEALDTDSILFSCIGYHAKKIEVMEIKNRNLSNITMEKKIIDLEEVVVRPLKYIRKNLGSIARSKMFSAGFDENKLGYEMGILIKTRRPVFLEKLYFNIASNTYDSLFYRINVYEVSVKNEFQNILKSSIYLSLSAKEVNETIEFDLRPYNLRLTKDFLISLEHVKDLGEGRLFFCAGMGRTYYRKTSQAKWESHPISVGINVDVLEERGR